MFNYQTCTIDELVQHVLKASRQTITQAKKYYTAKGDVEVVEKINISRIIAQQERITRKLDFTVQEGDNELKVSSMVLLNMFWKCSGKLLDMTPSERLFLSVLITYVDNKNTTKGVYEAYPSSATIEKRSGMSIKTIEKVRKTLKDRGWIKIITSKGVGNSNKYYINANKINEVYKSTIEELTDNEL